MPGALENLGLPPLGRATRVVLGVLLVAWIALNLNQNWLGGGSAVADWLVGDSERVLHGEVWRLLTAGLIQAGVGGLLFALLALYLFASPLEEAWGPGRLLRFLIASQVLAYAIQVLCVALAPSLTDRLVGRQWFGVYPAADAAVVAWGLAHRDRQVRMFFMIPVSGLGMVVLVGAINVLMVIGASVPASGCIAPFGAMLAGWLLGGNPSPLRRYWLELRLARLEGAQRREAEQRRAAQRARIARSGLRVIPRAAHDDEDDDDPRNLPN